MGAADGRVLAQAQDEAVRFQPGLCVVFGFVWGDREKIGEGGRVRTFQMGYVMGFLLTCRRISNLTCRVSALLIENTVVVKR